jgi:dipeptidyl aminopeptidase/acylaminoacyl peptidase
MPRDVRIEDLFRLILPGSPSLSPDGRRVVFTVRRLNRRENRYESHLWIVPIRGGRPRQLTRGLVHDATPTWSPDGRSVAFVSDRGDVPNVWELSLDGGEPRQVTSLKGGPITALSWSPRGGELLFQHIPVSKKSERERKRGPTFKHITRLYHKEDGFGWFADEFWGVWTASVRSGRTTCLTPGDHHDREPRWSPDGRRIAFISGRGEDRHRYPDLTSVYVMDRNGKRLREITPTTGDRNTPRWSLDGRHLYWLGYEGGPGEWLYHEMSVWRSPTSGRGKSEPLNLGHDRWAMNMTVSDTSVSLMAILMEVYADGDEERVAFGSDEEGCFRVYSLSSGGGDVRPEIDGNVSVLGLSVATDGDPIAVACVGTAIDTGELYRVRLDGSCERRKISRLTAPFFRPLRFREPEEFRVKSGKVDLQAWVLKPPGLRSGRKYPCLIEVHGGPMAQYGEAWFHEMQVLAAKGWVVAYCNPRGSSGRGMRFCNCIDGKWGKDDWADVQALTNAMARKPYVDAKRIGILGGSYGGYMTTWALGHTNRYRVGVTQRQAGDFSILWGASDYGWYFNFFFRGKAPWEAPGAYDRASPNSYVKNITTPLLIIHSEGDLRCPIAESEWLFTAMRFLDRAPCEMVRFEGESHGLSRGGKPRNREERLNRIVEWIERYL